MTTFYLNVNGERRPVDAGEDTPLVFVLRNNLGFKGPKIGCAQEQCGACAVLVDGERTLACVRAASEFQDAEIVTVEGLGEGAELSPVQAAFVEAGAAQCGYCTSGIVIAATALLAKNPKPDGDDIIDALQQHLCRCGSHRRVLTAIGNLTSGDA